MGRLPVTPIARGAARADVDDKASAHLPGLDYADAFAVVSPVPVPARVWAELALASGPEVGHRTFGSVVWRGVLGFDLAPPGTPHTMVGWGIVADEPELFVLATDGRLMAARMIFALSGSTLTWTTALRFHRTAARAIWAVAQNVHRALAPRLLDKAARALLRRGAALPDATT
jgi:hypothetical protein